MGSSRITHLHTWLVIFTKFFIAKSGQALVKNIPIQIVDATTNRLQYN
jgi:hypothetical protein